jgi:hypothetical protein
MASVNVADPRDPDARLKIGWQDRLQLGILFNEGKKVLAAP